MSTNSLSRIDAPSRFERWAMDAFQTMERVPVTNENHWRVRDLVGVEPKYLRDPEPTSDVTALLVFTFEDGNGFRHEAMVEQLREPGLYALRWRDDSEAGHLPYSYEPGELPEVFDELASRVWAQRVAACENCGHRPAVECRCYSRCATQEPPRSAERALREILSGAAVMAFGVVLLMLSRAGS